MIPRSLLKVFDILVFIGVPAIAGSIVLSKEIVLVVGGVGYLASALPLDILMMSFGFSLLGGCFLGNMVLLPSKKEKTYMYICCVATVINVVLNLILIRIWGAVAAAGTTTFCSFLMMLMMVVTRDKRIRLDYIFKDLLAPVIGSISIYVFCKQILAFITNLGLLIRSI